MLQVSDDEDRIFVTSRELEVNRDCTISPHCFLTCCCDFEVSRCMSYPFGIEFCRSLSGFMHFHYDIIRL